VSEARRERREQNRLHRSAARGSLTVELVVLTPVIALFVLVALGFGRYSLAREQLVGGARAAADAASVAGSAPQAQEAAVAAATPVLAATHSCVDPSVNVNAQPFVPGATVRVSVSCHVEFSDLMVPGFPGSTTLQVTQLATIDPYRSVQP
jgi:Flp pilus assembly protein TadG